MSHASEVKHNALQTEVERLRALIPDTENSRRNLAAIEAHCPASKMVDPQLSEFVNLLARSVP